MQLLVPPAVTTEQVQIILNGASGGGYSEAQIERLRRLFQQAGVDARILLDRSGEGIGELARRAMKGRPGVLVAGGGDGTLNAVANVVRGTDTALGILPLGTLNHFAKDLHIPLDIPEAVRTIAAGRRVAVDLGEVNGTAFLNNSSIGLYPNIVRERKRQQQRFRRSKRSAMVWATLAALHRSRLLDLRLELEDRSVACRAPFIFVGNSEYIMEGFNIGARARLDAGRLSVYTTQRSSAGGLMLLALRAMLGRLRQADDFSAFSATRLRVETPHNRLLVATDGEISLKDAPLDYRILPKALNVIVP